MSVLQRLKQIIPSTVLSSLCCALILAACLPGANSANLTAPPTTNNAQSFSTNGSPGDRRTFPWADEFANFPGNEVAQGRGRIRTDHAVYAEPPLPALPRAGGKFIDPVFGSEIMRATDEADGPAPGLGTYYSHWPTFNSNNTKLLIRKGETGEAIIKTFDPVNFQLRSGYVTLPSSFPAGGSPSWESSIWSGTDPNLIYTFPNYDDGGMRLYSYNIATKTFRLIKDFKALARGKDYFKQMYMSADEDVFCWLQHRVGANDGAPIAYVVYKRSIDKVLFHNSALEYVGGINEVHVDKSGKWLHIVIPTVQADGTGTRFLNLQTGQYQALRKEIDHPPGHGDLGTETMVGFDNYEGGISIRRLDKARTHKIILLFRTLQGKTDWTFDHHGSMLADDESWETVGTYRDPEINLPSYHLFEDEIMQVSTDGSQRIRRLCHTRTAIDNKTATSGYWATPKPTISKDGRYIAFTSNWEKSGRYDLFIVKVEPAEPLSPQAAPAATPTQRPRRVVQPR
jgi:WD40-like Beta Propeller Repeat